MAGVAALAAQDTVRVRRALPDGDLRPGSVITVSFDRPLAGQVERLRDPRGILGLRPAIAARVEWRDPATIRVIPESPLRPGTTLELEVVAQANETTVIEGWRQRFQVRPPEVIGTFPPLTPGNPRDLEVSGRILARISGSVDLGVLQASARFESSACAALHAVRFDVTARPPEPGDPWSLHVRPYEPAADSMERRFDQVVSFTPRDRPQPGCEADFVVALPEGGGLPVVRYRVRTAPAFLMGLTCRAIFDCLGSRTLQLTFSAPVPLADVKRVATVTPAGALSWPESASTASEYSLKLNAAAGTRVAVSVSRDLRDVHGRTIAGDTTVSFTTGDRPPALTGPTGLLTIARGAPLAIRIQHRNVDSATVFVRPDPRDDVVALGDIGGAAAGESGWRSQRVALSGALNQDTETVVPLDIPATWGSRLLVVRVGAPAERQGLRLMRSINVIADWKARLGRGSVALLQQTALMAHVRAGIAGGGVLVTDVRTGAPQPGVRVQLYNDLAEAVAVGQTNRNGLVLLEATPASRPAIPARPDEGGALPPDNVQWPYRPIRTATVAHDGDRAVISVAGAQYPFGVGYLVRGPMPWIGGVSARRSTIHTDRDIYRPGEVVHFTGTIRDGWLHTLRAPAPESIRWRVYQYDPEGRQVVLRLRDGTSGMYGVASDSLVLPATTRLGAVTIRLEREVRGRWTVASEASVRVAAYRAPEFTVEAVADPGQLMRGDTVRARVSARLLFDAPLAGAEVSWGAQWTELSRWEIRIPGLPMGWEVGEAPSWWGNQEPPRTVYLRGSGVTGTDGSVRLAVPSDTGDFPRGARLELSASVVDPSRQVVTASTTQVVAPASFYVAARVPGTSWYWRVGEAATVQLGAIGVSGVWREREPVDVRVVRRYWAPRGEWGYAGWEMRTDTVARDSLATRDSSGTWSFVPASEGIHEVVLTARDDAGRVTRTSVSRYTVGSGSFRWGDDPLRLQVFTSDDSVEVGDSLRVNFSSPFERAHAWVTVEREGVLHQERHDVAAGAHTLVLAVGGAWIPNAWVGVTLVRQGDLTDTDSLPARYRSGETMVTVDAAPKRLQVTLEPTASEYLPGREATIRVRLRDANGRAVRGHAVLWAVDEGVLSMTGFATPDPGRALLASSGRGVGLTTTLSSLLRALDLPPGGDEGFRMRAATALSLEQVVVTGASADTSRRASGAEGVAGGRVAPPRTNFRSTAFYRGGIVTNGGGTAVVRVRLPDNVTTFRLIAVAVDGADHFGVGERPLLVTKPLIVRAAMPRFVRPDDRFEAGGVINRRNAKGAMAVVATARGDATLSLAGATQRDVRVGPEGARADFDWMARRGTQARVTLGVRGDGLDDGVALTLPVRPDQFERARTIVALVRDTAMLRFALPAGIDPAASTLDIRVGPTALPVLRTWQDYLDLYPHACTEQVASTARGLIALLQLGEAGATRLRDAGALRRKLQRAVLLLVERQKGDGSFGYWTSVSWSTPWLTAYATHVLADARDLGIEVPGSALQLAGQWLERTLATVPVMPDTTYGNRAERRRTAQRHLAHRLAAIEALVRLGRTARLDEVVDALALYSFEDRARAVRLLGGVEVHREVAERSLAALWDAVRIVGNRAELPDSARGVADFPSRMRPAAMLLRATQTLAPRHPGIGPLAQMIIQRERADAAWWWNTQDYAWAAAAVAAFVKGEASRPSTFALTAANGRAVLRGRAGGQPLESRITLDGLTTAGAGDSVFLPVRVTANGPVYVTLTVREMLRERPVAADARGLIVERWYERFDNGATVTEVREGDLVRVRLRVTASADREFVAIEDPLPAGLEAVDTRLRTSSLQPFIDAGSLASESRGALAAGATGSEGWSSWLGWWAPRWYPWDQVESYDDRVVFHARWLGSGSHTMSYVARATTAGRFVRPTARAEEMYNPGLNGASDGGWFVVRKR